MKLRLLLCIALWFLVPFKTDAQELSPERKVYVIKNLQNDIAKLPYEIEYIAGVLIPETHIKRAELAPHYPDISTLERDQSVIDQAFLSWVTVYTHEYEAYKSYLEVFLRSHVNP